MLLHVVLKYFFLFLFMSGFLLTRFEVDEKSSCTSSVGLITETSGTSQQEHHAARNGCWKERVFSRCVIIIIDALRFDFAQWDDDDNMLPLPNPLRFYRNKLPVLHETLTEQPNNAALFPCWADPPTTTMQRLKGITTGSLPTFIDLSLNFNSPDIREDNIIFQLSSTGKRVTFMGDDTWDGLFPNMFNRSYSYPSFNVKDLHTVDNGVIAHLFPELKLGSEDSSGADDTSYQPDVVIAHFLGVDHVGHTFGPDNDRMSDKLSQMDAVLRKVIQNLDNDTLLLVMGDHGMTSDGNHGGATEDEARSTLFAYSRRNLSIAEAASLEKNNNGHHHHRVSQIDLVPTIALLMGAPIPYANLGSFLPFVIPKDVSGGAPRFALDALRLNAWQTHQYLMTYSAVSSSNFPSDLMNVLERKFEEANNRYWHVMATNPSWQDQTLREAAQSYMEYLDGTKEMCRSAWARFDESLMLDGAVGFLWMAVCPILILTITSTSSSSTATTTKYAAVGFCIFILRKFVSLFHYHQQQHSPNEEESSVSLLMLGTSSNRSVYSCLFHVLISTSVGQLIHILLQTPKFSFPSLNMMSTFAIIALVLRCCMLFSNSFIEAELKGHCFLLVTGFFMALRDAAKRESRSSAIACVIGIAVVGIGGKLGTSVEGAPLSSVTYPPGLSLVICLVSTMAIPVLAFRMWKHKHSISDFFCRVCCWACCIFTCIHWINNQFFHLHLLSILLPRLVYSGFLLILLATLLQPKSSLGMHLFCISNIVLALIGGEGMAPVVLLMLLFLLCLKHSVDETSQPSLFLLTLACLGSTLFFYAGGHDSKVSRLRISASFVGFDQFNFVVSGFLLLFDSVGAVALASIGFLYLSYPLHVSRCALVVSSYYGVVAALSTLFVGLQRRHLMVWAIFAPKFGFDVIIMAAIDLVTALIYCFASRTKN